MTSFQEVASQNFLGAKLVSNYMLSELIAKFASTSFKIRIIAEHFSWEDFQETLETFWLTDRGLWLFCSRYEGRKEGIMNAIPRHSNTKTTTHQALCGMPKNSSSQTVMKMEFVKTWKMLLWHERDTMSFWPGNTNNMRKGICPSNIHLKSK